MNEQSTEILSLLGGFTPLAVTIKAHSLAYTKDGAVTFRFERCKKANIVWIIPEQDGRYSIDFYWSKKHRHQSKQTGAFAGIQGEDLQRTIEKFTGLSLAH